MSPVDNARLLAARIPDAELVIVPGAGHAFPLERPRESFEAVARFLDRPIPAGRRRSGVVARAEPSRAPSGCRSGRRGQGRASPGSPRTG